MISPRAAPRRADWRRDRLAVQIARRCAMHEAQAPTGAAASHSFMPPSCVGERLAAHVDGECLGASGADLPQRGARAPQRYLAQARRQSVITTRGAGLSRRLPSRPMTVESNTFVAGRLHYRCGDHASFHASGTCTAQSSRLQSKFRRGAVRRINDLDAPRLHNRCRSSADSSESTASSGRALCAHQQKRVRLSVARIAKCPPDPSRSRRRH